MPHEVGSMSPIAALVAMAASTALPPFLSISKPTCAASGWLVATMPCGAIVTERPALPAGVIGRSAASISAVLMSAKAVRRSARGKMASPGENDKALRYRHVFLAAQVRDEIANLVRLHLVE